MKKEDWGKEEEESMRCHLITQRILLYLTQAYQGDASRNQQDSDFMLRILPSVYMAALITGLNRNTQSL